MRTLRFTETEEKGVIHKEGLIKPYKGRFMLETGMGERKSIFLRALRNGIMNEWNASAIPAIRKERLIALYNGAFI